ncbi:hypothetical protein ACFWPU_37115 [Streptomyces sp. NPDC058471]|uniref:hypothetical protein n=1 Tax=Streptomyces sp. NPDC058471 TaxID=3346516 RepID=UPI0036491C58
MRGLVDVRGAALLPEVILTGRRAAKLEQQFLGLRSELAERGEELAPACAANGESMAPVNRWPRRQQ